MKKFNLRLAIGLMSLMIISVFNLRYAHNGYGNALIQRTEAGIVTVVVIGIVTAVVSGVAVYEYGNWRDGQSGGSGESSEQQTGFSWFYSYDNDTCSGGSKITYTKPNHAPKTITYKRNGDPIGGKPDIEGYTAGAPVPSQYQESILSIVTVAGGPERVACNMSGDCDNPLLFGSPCL